MNIYVYTDENGKYYWELHDSKTNVIARSSVNFDKATAVISAFEHILLNKNQYKGVSSQKPDTEDKNIEKWFWVLNNDKGETVAQSPIGYKDKALAQKGITQLLSLTLGSVQLVFKQ